MTSIEVDEQIVEAAALGGGLLGGGGGGRIEEGLRFGKLSLAIGEPKIVSIEELADDASVLTVSLVGAIASAEQYLRPIHHVKAVELLCSNGINVDGLITSENGGASTLNGWFQSAILGIPVVDAPCNGRAHPTGIMGSIGLHKLKDYISVQSAVGGNPKTRRYIEVLIKGNLVEAVKLIRQASVSAGGLVAVARNPVSVAYAKEKAAVGAIAQAIEVGKAMLRAKASEPEEMIECAAEILGGKIVVKGLVEEVSLKSEGGFDAGRVIVKSSENSFELTFWNEYMTAETNGFRIGTFPDLIATLNMENGSPVPSADIKKGMKMAVLHVTKEKLKLGAGMKDAELFKQIEEAIGKKVINYVFEKSGES